jgi:ubiquinone biosynthesis protein
LFKQLSTARITALSEERGVKVTAAFAHEPAERRRRVAEQLIETLIAAPIFAREKNVVIHADTHAGNLLYDEQSGDLVVLDWALTERLTHEQRRHLALFGIMLGLRDALGVCHEIEALSLDAGKRTSALTAFVRQHVTQFIEKMPLRHLPGSMDAMRLLDRLALEGVRFPSSLLMFRKILFTLDGILHDIGAPDVHMDLVIVRYVASHWARNWISIGSPLTLMDWVTVQSSMLLFGGRIWVQWAQSALGAPAELRS